MKETKKSIKMIEDGRGRVQREIYKRSLNFEEMLVLAGKICIDCWEWHDEFGYYADIFDCRIGLSGTVLTGPYWIHVYSKYEEDGAYYCELGNNQHDYLTQKDPRLGELFGKIVKRYAEKNNERVEQSIAEMKDRLVKVRNFIANQ